MTDQQKTALSQEIKNSWLFTYENWYIHLMKRRGNRTAFYIVIVAMLVSVGFIQALIYPYLGFGFFMAYTSICSGIKEKSWAKKYGISISEVQALIGQVFP